MLFHGFPPPAVFLRSAGCPQDALHCIFYDGKGDWFARAAIRTHIFGFIVRPFQETRFREALKRIKEGDVAVWQRIPLKTSVYQGGCISKEKTRRKIPLLLQGQEHFSFGKTRRNGTIWKRIKDYFLSENTL